MPKPPNPAREYFGKIDAKKSKRIAREKRNQLDREERRKLRDLHWKKCAECGMEMDQIAFKGATIFKCFSCGGAFLNSQALEKLCGEESTFIESLLDIFRFK